MRVPLLALGLGLILALGPPASLGAKADPPSGNFATVKRVVIEESLRASVPPSLMLAVAEAASGFDFALNGPGERRGLLQISPRTAVALGGPSGVALFEPRTNARLGADYMKRLVRDHGGRLEPALAQFERGDPPGSKAPPETTVPSAFVNQVLRLQRRYQAEAGLWLAALKDQPVAWQQLRGDDDGLRRLAGLARRLDDEGPADDPWRDIERRRRAVLPYLDDFAISTLH